ncbi:MAG: HAMP domain-containing histidine kinase [Ruminococcus sp.]|nr:HAMP domain-containing histidine kinase [Ruminococcus sp.]
METVLAVICVCLSVLFLVLLYKWLTLKHNIRRFSQELEKLKDSDYRQPIKVTDLDGDLAELAVKLNEHTDIQRQLGVEYEQRKKQLGTVISGISHDFRTPLTAALGYMQMIEKSGGLSEKNAGYLDIAVQKNRYLKELSDEFFELTKMENGGTELSCEETDLSSMLTEAVLEQYSWIEKRKITAEFDITEGIVTKTDRHCAERILNNLMSNAEKYTADSFGAVLKREGGETVLTVYNGISEGESVDTARVFEPFYRMSARTAGGSGLGLYVVRVLCERLGWRVSAKEEKGRFFVEIRI